MNAPDRDAPVIRLRGAAVRFGDRVLFEDLDLDVAPREFLAIIGPNGVGKTTLLHVLLGALALSAGTVEVVGRAPRRGSSHVGYVPQQRTFDRDLPIRGRDLVRLGLDGHRFGIPRRSRVAVRRVANALDAVDAAHVADRPIGSLSGGEQQRLRIAQAVVGGPSVLLCDEPLLSLDLAHQQAVSAAINAQRARHGAAVLFVTHEINPILPYVDRVLYLVGGRWAVGTHQEVLTSEVLSDLYGTPVDVLHVRDRIVVVGADESAEPHGEHHHAHEHGRRDEGRARERRRR
ncbi:MAG: ATP-binding cassette domain-containing protein [Acidimicrobiia bacterium]